jgi:hypothetical protein
MQMHCQGADRRIRGDLAIDHGVIAWHCASNAMVGAMFYGM